MLPNPPSSLRSSIEDPAARRRGRTGEGEGGLAWKPCRCNYSCREAQLERYEAVGERRGERSEGKSLDLNNLPEEHAGKQPLEESSMTTAASADTTRK
ncbi:hypothetical protein GW17_00058227 [Ensete ventricosum]|nr:hypothetical protein GW17_00058227 [Ensete ventricosum]